MSDAATSRDNETRGRYVNPFATRYTRPGNVQPLNEDGGRFDAEELLAHLAANGGCGGFVGPHGSGKSTRLEAVAAIAAERGMPVRRIRLRRWRDVFRAMWAVVITRRGGLVCLDSLEQAGRVGTVWLRCLAFLTGVQMLGTSHTAMGLPTLLTCRTSTALLQRIVEQLPSHGGSVSEADLIEAFEASNGNLREALFVLYDRVETQRNLQRS
jgi:hypothetical protein